MKFTPLTLLSLLIPLLGCADGGKKVGQSVVPIGVISATQICDGDSGLCAAVGAGGVLSVTASTVSLAADAALNFSSSPNVNVVDSGGIVPTLQTIQGQLEAGITCFPSGTTTVAGTVTCTPSGTTTISGTVTANLGTLNGAATNATLTGGTAQFQMFDGTNVIGTSAHPVRVDPTGTTTQPTTVQNWVAIYPASDAGTQNVAIVSGTVTVNGPMRVDQGDGGAFSTNVANFPATQTIAGTVTANPGGTCAVYVPGFANTPSVNGTVIRSTPGAVCMVQVGNLNAITPYPCLQNEATADASAPCQDPLFGFQQGFQNYDQTYFGPNGEYFDAGCSVCMSATFGVCAPGALDAGGLSLGWHRQ